MKRSRMMAGGLSLAIITGLSGTACSGEDSEPISCQSMGLVEASNSFKTIDEQSLPFDIPGAEQAIMAFHAAGGKMLITLYDTGCADFSGSAIGTHVEGIATCKNDALSFEARLTLPGGIAHKDESSQPETPANHVCNGNSVDPLAMTKQIPGYVLSQLHMA